MPQIDQPIYLSEKESAAYLCISLSTIRRRRKEGTGPDHVRFGGILRYGQAALEEFIKKNTKTGK
jgi:predicted DNA-binding transcriptional regulator AlpA